MADENSINHILARLSSVEAAAAKIASLEARIEVMDDDIPEPQKRWVAEGSVALNVSLYMEWAGYSDDNSLYAKVTSGNWVHGYSSVQASDAVEPDGYIHVALNAALMTQYVYVQRGADLSVSIGTSAEYPVSSTSYLRRAVGKIELTGTPDPVTGRYSVAYMSLNFGDVYTW